MSDAEDELQFESLIATRARRSNAGSRLKQLLELEEQSNEITTTRNQFVTEDDENVDLLFQEDGDDEEFIDEDVDNANLEGIDEDSDEDDEDGEKLQKKRKRDENEESDDEVYIPPFSMDLLPKPIRDTINADLEGRREEILSDVKYKVLDVGCGGGILSESMARLSFVEKVQGIDLSTDVLEAAKLHKQKDPILEDKLSYNLMAIEDIPKDEKFDIVTMFEVLEHVDYPSRVLLEGLNRLEVGGWLFLSTINRDFVSWFTTIFMGEHLLRIVPVGTHTLEKYINQTEIKEWVEQDESRKASYKVVDTKGCVYLPAYGWKFTSCPDIGNYFMAIQRVQ